jgi:hypothetical protein
MCKHEKVPAQAAIILPVKSQYTQQDTAKIVVTCTVEDQRQLGGDVSRVDCFRSCVDRTSYDFEYTAALAVLL